MQQQNLVYYIILLSAFLLYYSRTCIIYYIEKLVVALKYILKSLRCGKKEEVSEMMKSIMYMCEVRIS